MIPALKRACVCARGYAYVGGSVCRLLACVCVCVYVNVVKQNIIVQCISWTFHFTPLLRTLSEVTKNQSVNSV